MKRYDDCREEIGKEFDVSFLFKRIIFLERAARVIFADHQFKGLHLHDKLTLEEAEKNRKHFNLKKKVKKIKKNQVVSSADLEDEITNANQLPP